MSHRYGVLAMGLALVIASASPTAAGFFDFLRKDRTSSGSVQANADPTATGSLPPAGGDVRPASPETPSKELVDYRTDEFPGTVVVHTAERALYLVLEGGKALKYAIGVGREGFTWSGTELVTRKQEWPDWRPPEEMRERQPYLPSFYPGGPLNPLGARAIYLGQSLYRIHGTSEDWTIGEAVSSGCIRMLNADIMDLYQRVPVGAKVVVRQG